MCSAGTQAQAASETIPALRVLSDMQAGRLLIRAGRLEHALVFLEQARPTTENESIERLFLLGRIELRLGRPERATERFEAILAQRPELTRVRLELARAYFLSGHDDKAKFHFRASLADELPTSVEEAVEGFLRGIDARRKWSASLSASILPETRRSGRDEVLIGGVPFRLNEDARASSGRGMMLSTGASFSPTISDEWRGVLAASAAAKLYRRSDWNDLSTSADIGLTRLSEKGSVSGGVRLGRRWVGGDGYQRRLGPWARARLQLSSSAHLGVAVSAAYQSHDARPDRDGWRISLKPRLLKVLNSRTSINVEPLLEWVEGEADHHGSRLVGLGTTITRMFSGGLSASVAANAHVRRFGAEDPLFGSRQLDRNLRLGISVLHRSLRFGGFAPYVGYSIEVNRSSIPIGDYRNHGVIAGVSRTF